MEVPGSMVITTRMSAKSSTISQTPKTPFTGNNTIIPSSVKSILLYDWWLVKADSSCGWGLAVAGFASRERAGLRVFYSAPISTRHGANILEAIDGIVVTVTGFINRSRTRENGFPPEVYNHFLLGFPFNWKSYVSSSSNEKSAFESVEANTSHSDSDHKSAYQNLESDLDDFAVTRLRDLLLSTCGESSYCIFMKSTGSKSSTPMATSVESGLNETTNIYQKENSDQDQQKKADIQDNGENDTVKDPSHAVQEAKAKMEKDFQVSSRGVYTRSMTRLKSSRNKQKVNSNVTSTTNISIADKEVDAMTDKAEGRRSSLRLRNRKQNQ